MAQEYPLPRFHFQVDWGGAKISFTEITGLVIEREKALEVAATPVAPAPGTTPSLAAMPEET